MLQTPLLKPPAMPGTRGRNLDTYRIAVRQFSQQILPAGFPQTTVWGYGSPNHPGSFNYPSFSIEATWGKPVQVEWRNELIDANGNYLPHLLPIDPTLHWANPPGGAAGRDGHPMFDATPGPYTGPVPMVTHLHGAHAREDSDGFAEAWYLPAANNIPAGYATTGTFYDYFNQKYRNRWQPGSATFRYANDQRASTLWFHDHTLGMTRANVYAGPAGFYLLRGGPHERTVGATAFCRGQLAGVRSNPLGEYGEIPIAIQDRSFNQDGSLFYPDSREFFDGYAGPCIPETHLAPIWNPEFFGNMMVVNGRAWPYLNVQRKRYRFRLLNGCNSRFLVLKLTKTPRTADDVFNTVDGDIWQIGADGGFLPKAARQSALLAWLRRNAPMSSSTSRNSTWVTRLTWSMTVRMHPLAESARLISADWESTGQVMKFIVKSGPAMDRSTHPSKLRLPFVRNLRTGLIRSCRRSPSTSMCMTLVRPAKFPPRRCSVVSSRMAPRRPKAGRIPITENPAVGEVQLWSLTNLTVDAHPIHLHQVQFQVVERRPFNGGTSTAGQNTPLPGETGFKDTVIAYPGEVTVVKAKFDIPGLFAWHCHIVEHEDNEMMRPFYVGNIPANLPRFV